MQNNNISRAKGYLCGVIAGFMQASERIAQSRLKRAVCETLDRLDQSCKTYGFTEDNHAKNLFTHNVRTLAQHGTCPKTKRNAERISAFLN